MISLHYSPVHSRSAAEKRIRRPVGHAKTQLLKHIKSKGSDPKSGQRQALWDAFHQALLTATSQGLEDPTLWHSLASHATDPKVRLESFTRVLTSIESELYKQSRSGSPLEAWTATHLYADSLYEIALIHHQEGRTAAARDCLDRAMPLAQQSSHLREAAHVIEEDPLPDHISQLMEQLPS
jgi:hypothetical protein